MKQFDNMSDFSAYLLEIAVLQDTLVKKAVSHCAKIVEREAKAEVGTYQEQAGPFIAWPELAESTKADRLRLGFTEDDPLLRTGELRDSIGTAISTDGMEAQIGSNDDKAVWQELGTVGKSGETAIPPRSFLGGAMVRKLPEIQRTLGETVYAALKGEKVLEGALKITE